MTEGFNRVASLLDRLPGMEDDKWGKVGPIGTAPIRKSEMEGVEPIGVAPFGERKLQPAHPGFGSNSLVAPNPFPDYPRRKPEGFPPIGRDGGGWKMECKQVPSSGPLGRYPGGRTPDFNPEVERRRRPGPWGRPAWPGNTISLDSRDSI